MLTLSHKDHPGASTEGILGHLETCQLALGGQDLGLQGRLRTVVPEGAACSVG